MITQDEIIEIGNFNKPHGINGEISATFFCEPDTVSEFSCLISNIDGIYVPFFIESSRIRNAQTLLLKIEGIKNEDEAKMLSNHEIYILKDEYSSDDNDEISADYFIGFTVADENSVIIGTIDDIDDSTENALFIVRNQEREILIPIADEYIYDIDYENKIIKMNLPKGMIEL
jgi:16S rRNA processing protein rimM